MSDVVPILQAIEKRQQRKTQLPDFKVGDTVKVSVLIKEGEKERAQAFEGVVIKRTGAGNRAVVHRAQGELRRRRRARLPAAHAAHREDRSHRARPRPPRAPLLLARSRRQGGSHQGEGGHLGAAHRAVGRRPTSSRRSSSLVSARASALSPRRAPPNSSRTKAIASSTATGVAGRRDRFSCATTSGTLVFVEVRARARRRATARPSRPSSILKRRRLIRAAQQYLRHMKGRRTTGRAASTSSPLTGGDRRALEDAFG